MLLVCFEFHAAYVAPNATFLYLPKSTLKGGFHLNTIFPPLDVTLMGICHSHFKQSKNSIIIL